MHSMRPQMAAHAATDGKHANAKQKCPSAYIPLGHEMAHMHMPKKNNGQKHCSTSGSHVIPQRSTGEAQPNLTSVIGREPVCCGWYDRSIPMPAYCNPYTHKQAQHQSCHAGKGGAGFAPGHVASVHQGHKPRTADMHMRRRRRAASRCQPQSRACGCRTAMLHVGRGALGAQLCRNLACSSDRHAAHAAQAAQETHLLPLRRLGTRVGGQQRVAAHAVRRDARHVHVLEAGHLRGPTRAPALR